MTTLSAITEIPSAPAPCAPVILRFVIVAPSAVLNTFADMPSPSSRPVVDEPTSPVMSMSLQLVGDGVHDQAGPEVASPGTFVSVAPVMIPVFVASGKPHMWGDAEQPCPPVGMVVVGCGWVVVVVGVWGPGAVP